MRIRSVFVLLATSALTLTAVPSAQASHAWGSYHWARTANPFTLSVGDNMDPAWDGYLDEAIKDWDTPVASAPKVMHLVEATGTTSGRKCRASAGTVQVCNAAYGRNGWLGLATINITGGTHITQGTAKMNDTYFAMAAYNNADEKQHVVCQEIGHTFGLGHTSENGSSQDTCMDYSSSATSTGPNAHDFEQLAAIYAHLDTTTTIKATSANSPSVGEDRSSWGREVHRSADGSHSVFERDFGHGNRVITHVTWALRH